MADEVLVELDDRRRAYLARVGIKRHSRYLVVTAPDGSMTWTPAVVIPEHQLRLMSRPDVLAAIRNTEEHPEQLVRRDLRVRREPAVDWEIA